MHIYLLLKQTVFKFVSSFIERKISLFWNTLLLFSSFFFFCYHFAIIRATKNEREKRSHRTYLTCFTYTVFSFPSIKRREKENRHCIARIFLEICNSRRKLFRLSLLATFTFIAVIFASLSHLPFSLYCSLSLRLSHFRSYYIHIMIFFFIKTFPTQNYTHLEIIIYLLIRNPNKTEGELSFLLRLFGMIFFTILHPATHSLLSLVRRFFIYIFL